MIRAALAYAARGWPVLPLSGKVPTIPKNAGGNGSHDATTDEQTIRAWWRRHPDANVGVTLPGLVVVDVDQKHKGPAWLRENAARLRVVTLTAKTGGGGWHLYFRRPEGIELRGMIVKGVDLRRGAGHYVVAPPSIHPETGCIYEWIPKWPSEPVSLPLWLLEQCRRPEPVVRSVAHYDRRLRSNAFQRAARYLDKCDVAISGAGGHNTTFAACLKLVGSFPELTEDECWILIGDWNQRCRPPWNERELRHKLDDAMRTARGRRAA
jgi:hypothetical protein